VVVIKPAYAGPPDGLHICGRRLSGIGVASVARWTVSPIRWRARGLTTEKSARPESRIRSVDGVPQVRFTKADTMASL
jgi:hypothetical protein